MKRFRFRLQRLLELRRHQERAARGALSLAQADLAAADERARAIEQAWLEHRRREAEAGGLERALLAGAETARARVRAQRAAHVGRVEMLRVEYSARRSASLALERLRERALHRWRQHAVAVENAEMEELDRLARHDRGEDASVPPAPREGGER